MARSRASFALLAVAAVGCGDRPVAEALGQSPQPIVGGRPSTASENYSVYIEAGLLGDHHRCSGTLVAPNVVVTVRHCLLLAREKGLACTPEGELANPSDPRGQDTRVEAPENIYVYLGDGHAALTPSSVRAVFVASEIGLCRSDIGLLLLEQPLADVHIPIRREAVRVGELFSISGWGYTGDEQAPNLPERRSTLDRVRVAEVGPGLIPAGTFAVPGNTLCFGDSGAGALFGGALAGVYSSIAGPSDVIGTQSCTLVQGRNMFTMTAPHLDLFAEAFAQAEAPLWYAGEPAPWAAASLDAGSDAGDDAAVPDSTGEAAVGVERSSSGCSIARCVSSRASAGSWLLLAFAVTLRRRR